MRATKPLAVIGMVVFTAGLATVMFAAGTPNEINYQGVLRGSSGSPLDGAHDMVFRFFNADTGGDEVLVDTHDTASGNPVTVSQGLFAVALGGGVVADGSGPGTFTALDEVLAAHTDLWLSIQVNGELLTPRVQLLAAGYALNAASLQGREPSDFLDTSTTAQTKGGPLAVQAAPTETKLALDGGNWNVTSTEGDFKIGDDTHRFKIGVATGGGGAGDVRMRAVGGSERVMIGAGASDVLTVRDGQVGINNPTPTAALDVIGTSTLRDGLFVLGDLFVTGGDTGGLPNIAVSFSDGGYIADGINLLQIVAGDADTDHLFLGAGNGNDGGLSIFGGGEFHMSSAVSTFRFNDGAGTSVATLSPTLFEMDGSLQADGGLLFLGDAVASSLAGSLQITSGDAATDHLSLHAGNGSGNGGITAFGGGQLSLRAGNGLFRFYDDSSSSELASIDATGRLALAGDLDVDGTDISLGAASSIKEVGVFQDLQLVHGAASSFFQVYDGGGNEQMRINTGDEIAALFDGPVTANGIDYAEAFHVTDPTLEPGDVVALDLERPGHVERAASGYAAAVVGVISEAPGFVTGNSFEAEAAADPELAHLRQQALEDGDHDLARQCTVELMEKKRQQLRPVALMGRVPVKVDGSYGAIRPGDPLTSSPTPGHAMAMTRPGPSIGTALEGWSGGGAGRVLVFINRSHAVPAESSTRPERAAAVSSVDASTSPSGEREQGPDREQARPSISLGVEPERSAAVEALKVTEYFRVSQTVEPGDVLIVDPEASGSLRPATELASAAVVGVVAGHESALELGADPTRVAAADPARARLLEEARRLGDGEEEQRAWSALKTSFEATHAPVALIGTVSCKVDAGYGSIRPGDLLVTSPTPGHAMRADADAAPGTVFAKALEPLEAGTAVIRALVWPR